jgi:hypothetical protein
MRWEIAAMALTHGRKRAKLRSSPPEQLNMAEQLTEIVADLWDPL